MAKSPRIKTKDSLVEACPRGTLPVLYKKTTGGGIQMWEIWVVHLKNADVGRLYTRYGLVDGKQQEISEDICSGKNQGRGNETSPYEQACLEAAARWDKQKNRKAYTEDDTGEESAAIRALSPMLAHKFKDHRKKVDWDNAVAQPKLNGFRCLVRRVGKKLQAFSRENQPLQIPHILEELDKAVGDEILDGELYTHGMTLQQISSACKKLSSLTERVNYNVYDVVAPQAYMKRIKDMHVKLSFGSAEHLRVVESVLVRTESELMTAQAHFIAEGYEGAMLRHGKGGYEAGKRSANLLKVKTFFDEEFEVVDFKMGRGKMAGVPVFTCVTAKGHHFDVLCRGTMEKRQAIGTHAADYIGKKLTVSYQEFTHTEEPVPFHPVGLKFKHEDE